ncbi:MAG: hypothetical protein RL541_1267 [Pseudomonadota bacterium]|jgi:hypothetical protein
MKTRIYQICYSPETMANVPDGFLMLNNVKNERADWREYWPIREFLRSNHLSDDVLYGFMSPKFGQKAGLQYQDIQKFLNENYSGQDVVSFSPFWDLVSIFKNVFEQGDFFHPGLSDTCQLFADAHVSGLNLQDSITHSQNTIFCNYFLAKKSFWLEWLALGELLFHESENQQTELSKKLNDTTSYGVQNLPMKIFVQERLATICLLANPKIKCLAYSPFEIGASTTLFNQFLREAILSDALKIAYSKTQQHSYLREFSSIRNEIIATLARTGEVEQ